jgi:hypothetical protein
LAIILRNIQSETQHGVTAMVEHCGHAILAMVVGDPSRLLVALGATLVVELDFANVISCRVLAQDVPESHGLFPLASGDVRVVGVVHNIIDTPEGYPLIDVYLQAGPEFVLFASSSLACTPALGSGLEVVVRGLRFFPTW